MAGVWTMDELVERVRRALAAEYSGAPNGRVRDVPDRRAIRWYTTTGMVDRPLGMRGRTALYGSRHLLQVVAVKRRQAQGRSLAEIQAELTGATDAELLVLARVPEELLKVDGPAADLAGGQARTRFWAAAAEPAFSPAARRPAHAESALAESASAESAEADSALADSAHPDSAHPDSAHPDSAHPDSAHPDSAHPDETRGRKAPIAGKPAPGAGGGAAAADAAIGGVALGGGAILVLPGIPTADDRDAIAAAAGPLLDLLADRGLLSLDGRTS
jgi:hypothetical protein